MYRPVMREKTSSKQYTRCDVRGITAHGLDRDRQARSATEEDKHVAKCHAARPQQSSALGQLSGMFCL